MGTWSFENTIDKIGIVRIGEDNQRIVLEMLEGADLPATLFSICISIPLTDEKEYCKKVTELLRLELGNKNFLHELLRGGISGDNIIFKLPFRIYPGTNVTVYFITNDGYYHHATFTVKGKSSRSE